MPPYTCSLYYIPFFALRKALKGKFRQSGIKFPQFGHTVGMGKKIDALVAVLLGTLAAYGFFLAATGRPYLALALAGVCMLALRRVMRTCSRAAARLRQSGARARRRCAKHRVEGWLLAREEDACSDIVHLLAQAYPAEISAVNGKLIRRDTGALVPLVFLPRRAPILADDVLSVWKAHRGAESAILVSTAPLGSGMRIPPLSGPRVAVVGCELLEKLAAKHLPVIAPTRAPSERESRVRGLLRRYTDRKKAPRYMLYGALMLAIYLLLGTRAYLAAALFLLLLAGLGLRRAGAPDKLL